MCCATANYSSDSTEDKESARSIFTAILLCLIEEKQSIISAEIEKSRGNKKKFYFLLKKDHNYAALAPATISWKEEFLYK